MRHLAWVGDHARRVIGFFYIDRLAVWPKRYAFNMIARAKGHHTKAGQQRCQCRHHFGQH